jgi:glycerophosphoryl diester phosphodiesterase
MYEPPLAFAHRGGANVPENLGIENSLVAFRNAHDLGYRYFETDVRASRDGVVYACHDETLERLTGRKDHIAAVDSAKIDAQLLGEREPMSRLADLLTAFPDTCFNIDVKSDDVVTPTIAVIRELEAVERVCLASFNHRRLVTLRNEAPELLTSASTAEAARLRLRLMPSRAPQFYQVPVRHHGVDLVTPSFINRAHRAGQQVHVWTIDDPAQMHRLLDMGVDGLMTDRTDLLKEVLVKRGQWKDPA